MLLEWGHLPRNSAETVVVACPGPSLTREQIELVRASDALCIAVSEVGRVYMPDADIVYHAEKKWWTYYNGCPHLSGIKLCMEESEFPDVYQVPTAGADNRQGICTEFPKLCTGYNTGYQAINLAAYFKPKKIILIGYDLKKGINGVHNIIGDHPKELKRTTDFKLFMEGMKWLVKPLENLGINVYNCSIDTALDCFPKRELIDVLT